jgi:uroporphyrinogen-III synthase
LERIVKILSTALLPEAARVALSAQQIHCEEHAFVETERNLTDEDAAFIKDLAKQKVVVMFTSAQAVTAVMNCLGNEIPDWLICCISGATQTALLAFFGEDKIIASAKDAIDLLEAMQEITPQKVVFFCGNKRLDTLPVSLIDRGFELIECKVYDTFFKPQKLSSNFDALLFYSPSGVDSFFMMNEISKDAVLFSIGKTTANALQQKVNNEVIISAQPDKNILVQTVIDFYKK